MAKAKAAAKASAKPAGKKPAGRKPGTLDHPQSTRDEFRAHYLLGGVVAHAARAVNVPERTGHDWATELQKDPAFTEERRVLRARYLDDLVGMRQRVAQRALEQFEGELPVPEHVEEGGHVTIIDKRPDYGKLVLDAEKNAHNLAKLESPTDGEGGKTEVHVHLAPTG